MGLIHDVPLFQTNPVKVFSFEFRHEFVQSINLLSLSTRHKALILKMQHEMTKFVEKMLSSETLEFIVF